MDISRLSDEELWARAVRLAAGQRDAVCDLVETLAEIDRRGLPEKTRGLSLFAFCVRTLKLSEAAAYRRIRAARAIKLLPPIGPLLRAGELTLESIALLHPYLSDPDASTLVHRARGKPTWEVERLVAPRRADEPRREVVRFVASSPAPVPGEPREAALLAFAASGAAPSASVPVPAEPPLDDPSPATLREPARLDDPPQPSRPRSVRIAFTAGEPFFKRLCLARAAMRHKFPDGRLDGIFYDALDALLRRKTPWAYRRPRGRPRAR